jgi:hypothetical protein
VILLRLLAAVLAGFAALLGRFLWALLGLAVLALAGAAGVFFLWALLAGVLYLCTDDPAFLRGFFRTLGMGAVPFALMLALMFAAEEAKDAWHRFLERRRKPPRPTDAAFGE